jgi:hypothetical protein
MTEEEIIEMAKKSGCHIRNGHIYNQYIGSLDQVLKKFAKLVAEKEREACDAICLYAYEWAEKNLEQDDKHFAGRMRAAQDIGNEIRARGQE